MRALSLSTVPPLVVALPEVRPLRLTLLTLELERAVPLPEEAVLLERTALEALPVLWEALERTALPEALPVEVPELERTALELPVEPLVLRRTSCWLEAAELERVLLLVVEPERTALELEELERVADPVLPVERLTVLLLLLVVPLLRRTSCWLAELERVAELLAALERVAELTLLERVAEPVLLERLAELLAELERVAELLALLERVVLLERVAEPLVLPPLLRRVWEKISGAVTRERTSTIEAANVINLFMASEF